MNSDRAALAGSAVHAFKWNVLGVGARTLLQFGAMVPLARLIEPAGFGFFGACMLAYGISTLVAERGLGVALVQREVLPERLRHIAWGHLLLSHGLLAAGLFGAAPWLAAQFDAPGLRDGMRFMALVVLVTSFTVLPTVELRRRIDFRRIQAAQVGGYFAGYVLTAIPLAVLGWGGWSLLMAMLVQQAVIAGMVMRAAPHSLRPHWGGLPQGLPAFGWRVVGSNIANWVTENLDNLLIGRFKGVAALGLYSVSYSLARTPVNHVVNTVQQVVFATASRVGADDGALARGYLALCKAVGLVALPVFFGAAVVPDSVVQGLYGERWAQAAPAFSALCVAMPFHALMAIAGPILWGRGRTGVEVKVQAVVAAVLAMVLMLLMDRSLTVLAWAVCGVYVLRAIWMTAALAQDLAIPATRILRALVMPALLAGASMTVLWALQAVFAAAEVAGALRLLALIGGAALVLAPAVLLWPQRILGDDLAFLVARLPLLGRLRAVRGAAV